jgi:hypothetical protein
MIDSYVNKLIENLPEDLKNNKKPLKLDLVLGGGAFNGSYLIGALYFLKEMENRGYVIIERISGCSIGSLVGLLYLTNQLDKMVEVYQKVITDFKDKHNLSIIKNIKSILFDSTSHDMCNMINNKLYICYNNTKKLKKIVKNHYKNNDDLYNTIIKSCYIPYLVDEKLTYKNKYIDGINPYIFKKSNNKILLLDLLTSDKIKFFINIKNESTNYHRILYGLLEIHTFFVKKTNTQMCSYVDEWSIIDRNFFYLKLTIEKIFIHLLSFFIVIESVFHNKIKDLFLYRVFIKLYKEFMIMFIDTYCF